MATTSSRARTRERREEVGNRILAAAEELVQGGAIYTELPLREVAERAGVARSTLYLHFPDKNRLLIALAEYAIGRLFDAAVEWWQRDHGDGRDGLRPTVEAMVAEFRRHQPVILALVEVAAYDPDMSAYYFGRLSGLIDVIADRLDRERRAGAVAASVDPRVTATVLTCTVERTLTVVGRTTPGADDEQLVAQLTHAIWAITYGSG